MKNSLSHGVTLANKYQRTSTARNNTLHLFRHQSLEKVSKNLKCARRFGARFAPLRIPTARAKVLKPPPWRPGYVWSVFLGFPGGVEADTKRDTKRVKK